MAERNRKEEGVQSSDDDEPSHEIAMANLSLAKDASSQTHEGAKTIQNNQCKTKDIRKRKKQVDASNPKDKNKNKIQILSQRIKELQKEIADLRRKEELCPHCSFYINKQRLRGSKMMPQSIVPASVDRRISKDSLQFQKINFNSVLMGSPQMEQKSWIFIGTIMIAMGSKVMGMDGTMNVFKVLKQSVESIRRQVQKCEPQLGMDFFLSRELYEPNNQDDLGLFIAEPNRETSSCGLQLEGVKIESIDEYELTFDHKVTFDVSYEALLTIMEYVREYCTLS